MNKTIIYFACDSGMGSSALGASLLKKRSTEHFLIKNCSVHTIPSDATVVIVQNSMLHLVKNKGIKVFGVEHFLDEIRLIDIMKELVKNMENQKILLKDSIHLGLQSVTSDEAIVAIGKILLEKGYIEEPYIQGMLNRDHDITTYIGNDLAIPHGEYDVKQYVKQTGIAVMVYPNGIDWHGQLVRIVVGIAAKGDEHMEILSNIAVALCDMDTVDTLVSSHNIDVVYNILGGE